jgi:hypothetical protein
LPSPDEWRDVLVRRLDARWAVIQDFDKAYEGQLELSYATKKFYEVYGSLFRALANNWMRIVVDASAERLRVQGFRFGGQDADDEAWEIWQANGLDGESNMLHTESIKLSEAYWMVQPNGDAPRITAEHPSQVIVATDPADRRIRLAALKKWKGDDGKTYANVYTPTEVFKYRTKRSATIIDLMPDRDPKWETIGRARHNLGSVPIVPAPNNPSMIHGGTSDLAGGPLSIQKAIDKLCADMLVGSETTAFKQRVMLGVDQPRDSNGKPIPLDQVEAKVAASKFLFFPGADAKAYEFGETNLEIIRSAIDGYIRDLTAQTRTPPHYVAGQIVNASGDALKAAETGLVSKVRDKMAPFGEAHEEAMRLAFKARDADDPRASETKAETIWADPESRSQAETVDAAVKKQGLGVPWEQIMEDIGYSPQQIDRMQAMRDAEGLIADVPANGNGALDDMAEAMRRARVPAQPGTR